MAKSLNNHGGDLLRNGQAAAARDLLAEALEMRRAAFGRDDHPDVRNTAGGLVAVLLVLARGGDAAAEAEAEARDLCGRFSFDLEGMRVAAADYPNPR